MMAAILRGQCYDSVVRCGLYAATLSMQSHDAVPGTISPQCVGDEFIRRYVDVESHILMS